MAIKKRTRALIKAFRETHSLNAKATFQGDSPRVRAIDLQNHRRARGKKAFGDTIKTAGAIRRNGLGSR